MEKNNKNGVSESQGGSKPAVPDVKTLCSYIERDCNFSFLFMQAFEPDLNVDKFLPYVRQGKSVNVEMLTRDLQASMAFQRMMLQTPGLMEVVAIHLQGYYESLNN